MADNITLDLTVRETLGKGVKRLRREGIVPAVIHDHGKDSVHVQADVQVMNKAFIAAGKNQPVALTPGPQKFMALFRTVTRDPRLNTITHVVFEAIDADEKVAAEIPVKPRYAEGDEASPAEKAGLIVLAQAETVTVKALLTDLPQELTYDAAKLIEVGDQVLVSDLAIPKGVELETDPEHVLATVFEPSALAAANEAAAGDAEEAAPTEEAGDEAAASSEAEASEEK